MSASEELSERSRDGVLHVRISRATEVVWEGDAYSVTAKNADGPFDILPMHAHFISILDSAPIMVESKESGTKTFTFEQSVMHVKDDMVNIYTNIA